MDVMANGFFLRFFSRLPDPRAVNKIHKLHDLLTIAIMAVICGADGWVQVAMLGRSKMKWLSTFLELPSGIPSHDTLSVAEGATGSFHCWTLMRSPGNVLSHIHPVANAAPLTFRIQGVAQPDWVTLQPYYQTHFIRYTFYFRQYASKAEFDTAEKARQDREAAAAEIQRALDARTVDQVSCGEQQSENDHHFESEHSSSGPFMDTHWRDATGWFEYQMKVSADRPTEVMCTYWGSDRGNRKFDIVVDGHTIGTQSLKGEHPDELFKVSYRIPPELTKANQQVTVRFVAAPNSTAGGVFGVRTVVAK